MRENTWELMTGVVYLAPDMDIMLTPCSDGSYCCGSDNEACCELGEGYFIVNGEVVPASSVSSTMVSSTTQSATGTATKVTSTSINTVQASTSLSSSSASSSSSSSSKLGLGLGVGIGVGLLAAATILALAIILSRKQKGGRDTIYEHEEQRKPQEGLEKDAPKYSRIELDASPRIEVPDSYNGTQQPAIIAELPGDGRIFEK
jgi:hypothetical protein